MGKIVHLHGGPWHGQDIQIPADQDHIHIMGPTMPQDTDKFVPVKEGMYSQVAHRGHEADFEWDGWRSHDHE